MTSPHSTIVVRGAGSFFSLAPTWMQRPSCPRTNATARSMRKSVRTTSAAAAHTSATRASSVSRRVKAERASKQSERICSVRFDSASWAFNPRTTRKGWC